MTRSEVISKVMVCIDEVTPQYIGGVTLDGDDLTNPVKFYIDELLNDATDDVQMIAPTNRLPKNSIYNDLLPAEFRGVKYFTLAIPKDFLRVALIKMDTWERSVTFSVSVDSEAYRMVRNPHTTAGASKPVVAFINQTLELYGGGSALENKDYIYRWYFAYNTGNPIDELVLDAICWRCAVKALSVMGSELVKQATENYNFALQKLGI